MIEILVGSVLLSVVHFLLPNHWLPLVTLSRSERWTLPETINVTVLAAFAHTGSTIALGIVIGLIGYRLSGRYESFATVAAPLILLGMGLLYFTTGSRHAGHAHFPDQARLRRKSKAAPIVSLCVAMFFSPCFEIEPYFLAAGAFGWPGIGMISAAYLLVSVTGMTLMVWIGYRSLQRLQWHWLEDHEKKITGTVLIGMAIAAFYVQ